jgi:histidyl-tRNA synthetase
MLYKAPRGTVDILPEEQSYWRHIEQKVAHICQLYGYERIDFPVFEETGLFQRSVGEGTDIVDKEMYTFADKSGNMLTLRPEGTASVCRAYLEHGMHNLPQPVRLFYLIPAFRYERPQAGRYRQHHQFGIEAVGDLDPAIDAEVIEMGWQFLVSLGLSKLTLHINSIGCKKCRPGYLDALKGHYSRHGSEVCADCQVRIERNPMRLLDCKEESCQPIADAAPKSVDYLCPDCAAHFSHLQGYLKALSIPFRVTPRLVRGLDYYTRTVFEIQPAVAGSQSTILGGGRYDDLIEELGGKPTPANGFATGIERIILNLKKQNITVPPLPRPQVFIAYLGEEAKKEALKLASALRKKEIGIIMASGDKSLKAQLRLANNLAARYAVIIGEEEVSAGTVILRDMTQAKQHAVPRQDLAEHLK